MEYSFEGSDATNKGTFTSVRVPMVLKKNFPEVKDAVIMTSAKKIIQHDNNLITENKFLYADSSFFNIFSFPLLKGDKRTVLADPYNVVLTTSTAKKYFGDEDPIGKTLQVTGDSNLYKITGVAADCPANSQIQFDFVASFSTFGIDKQHYETYWDANYTTYILLNNEHSLNGLQAKMPAFMKKEMEGQHATVNLSFEPFEKVHLYSPYDAFAPNVSITYIYILAAVALLILLIACFTYINLSTARSVERAKEVSIRKVAGAKKGANILAVYWRICLCMFYCSSAWFVMRHFVITLVQPAYQSAVSNIVTVLSTCTFSCCWHYYNCKLCCRQLSCINIIFLSAS